MKRAFVAVVLATACGGSNSSSPETTSPDSGGQLDAFITPDAGFITLGDGSVGGPDGGLSDPTVLAEGFQSIGNVVRMYTRIRGTLTSTMPPVVFLNTGPFLGNEYLLEPMGFLLGPSPEQPDRLHIHFDMSVTGQSGFPTGAETTSVQGHLAELNSVLDWVEGWLGRSTAFDIVGHGYGAGIAVLYTADNPARISRLVLVAPHPANINQHAEWYAEWNSRLTTPELNLLQEITRWDNCLRSVPRCSLDYWNIVGPTWMCPENEDSFQAMLFENVDMRGYWSRGFINTDLRSQEFDWTEAMGRVDKPTTIIAGRCDAIPFEAAQTYTASISTSTLHVFDNAGHFPFIEDRTRFQQIVKDALTY